MCGFGKNLKILHRSNTLLEACCLDNVQTFSRRYITLEKALLHCLNGFNENANIQNRYQSLQDYLLGQAHGKR